MYFYNDNLFIIKYNIFEESREQYIWQNVGRMNFDKWNDYIY